MLHLVDNELVDDGLSDDITAEDPIRSFLKTVAKATTVKQVSGAADAALKDD